ncbi:MAG TPA: S8 family serine peptidase [Thermoanaerobaculia bacterium]
MTIRSGRSHSLLLALIAACAPQLFGAQAWPYAQTAKSDAPRETVFQLDRPNSLGVIVEFNEAPLLESRGTKDVRLASASLDALTTQLAKDLARIEGSAGRVAAQAGNGGAIRHTYRMVFAGASATVSRASLAAIRALPYVRAVHEDGKVEAYLARSVPHIGVPEVWQQYGRRGKGIVVAIIDTGVDYGHFALGEGFGPGYKVAGGWDFANDDADPMDDYGHGTHVAGIVAANHKYLTGVAPEATLLAYKVLDENGSGDKSAVLAGVERAIDPNDDGDPSDRADVVNMSLGGFATPDDPVIAAVERGAAAGVVFSLAAGNTAALGGLGSPGLAPSAITVAASDLEDKVATFSTGGPAGGTWSLKPEIAAPGVDIVSSVLSNRTIKASGTSMAAPHVAGVAALLLEQHPHWTPQDVKTAIVSTAKPILGRQEQAGRFMTYAGGGRIDALAAMRAFILPSQPAATFGMVAKKGEPWTSTSTVTLTNRGSSSETLTLKPPVVPAGATLTVVPETLTLAPGASGDLQLTLQVAPDAQPNDSGIMLSGVIELTGTATSLQLPWTILKADIIQATVTGDDEFEIYMSNGYDPAAMWPAGPRSYAALIPYMLSSDVVVLLTGNETTDPRLIIRERQPVEGYTHVTISPDEAKYRVRMEAVDERGVPLEQLSPDATGRLWHRFEIPSARTLEVTLDAGRAIRISSFKETLFRTYETRQAGTHRYFASYRHLRNVKQDEVLTLRPSDWASQKIRALCDKPECTVSLGAGLSSALAFTYYPFPPGTTDFTLHLTPLVDPRYDFRAYALVREKDTAYGRHGNPWTFISGSLRNVGGRFSTSPFGRVSGAEYYPPDREAPLVLGDGPVILRTSVGPRRIHVEPFGFAGELFGEYHARNLKVSMERLAGEPVRVLPTENGADFLVRQEPGAHRLVITDKYTVAGRAGQLTQTSLFDTRADLHAPDGAPSLSTLRIENGRGIVSTTLAAGSPSRLIFAARESLLESGGTIRHSRVDPSATQAWWRRHGTTEWLPLSVSSTGEDYTYKTELPGSPGSLFSASLAPATAAEGEVDLKVFIRNLSGGTTEVVYEPAFVVGPAGTRRRTMR